jgi:hypothetical protein
MRFNSKVLKDALSVDKLLGHAPGSGKHGKATVCKVDIES